MRGLAPRAALVAATLAAAAAAARPAAAQEQADPERRARAEEFFRAGERAFKADQYQDAAQLFEEAYATLPLPAIAFSAAQAYRLQYAVDGDARRLKRAVELYQTYVTDEPKGARVGDAARYLAELRPLLAAVEQKAGAVAAMPVATDTTRINISTTADIPDARASIDGGPEEPLPILREIAPGRHRIRVTAEGYFPFDESREVLERQTRLVEVELRPRPAIVSVRSGAGAQVSVDGRPAGTTPLVRPLELSPGAHLVTVTRRGHRPWSREISVDRGERIEVSPTLESTGQRRLSYAVVAASGALALGAGAAFGLSLAAGGDASELEDRRQSQGLTAGELERYQDAVARRDGRMQATWILLGASGVVALSGALLYYMDNPRPEAQVGSAREPASLARGRRPDATRGEGPTVTPTAGAGSVGLALGGRF
ncbi:MAG TPA: PEGA domain-containing protein [Kofleriaceae bacterium]|nr:PEGA domain-containing protein [Kofleriaceae bacterium]